MLSCLRLLGIGRGSCGTHVCRLVSARVALYCRWPRAQLREVDASDVMPKREAYS